MMKQQTDKFFRDKLEHHQLTPPPPAWDRIEAGLSKKNKPATFWLKIAASLLIVATAAYVLWPEGNSHGPAIADDANKPAKVDSTNKQKDVKVPAPAPETTENLVAERKSNVVKEKPNTPSAQKANTNSLEKKTETQSHDNKPVVAEEQVPAIIENSQEGIQPNAVAQANGATENKVAASEKNIKITISATESEKFLNKNALAQATPNEKKTSTLKKLLDKAEDMDPFGNLRQKKNEILALNFRSEKNQRGQNK